MRAVLPFRPSSRRSITAFGVTPSSRAATCSVRWLVVWSGISARARYRSSNPAHHNGVYVEYADLIEQSRHAVAQVACLDTGCGGTGFLVSPDVLVTNTHVVSSVTLQAGSIAVTYSKQIRVRLSNTWFDASLLNDPDDDRPIVYDYALLKVIGLAWGPEARGRRPLEGRKIPGAALRIVDDTEILLADPAQIDLLSAPHASLGLRTTALVLLPAVHRRSPRRSSCGPSSRNCLWRRRSRRRAA